MTRYQVAQLAHKYMDYDMIRMHTELPEFPDGRMRLLHAVLGHGSASAAPHKELLSLATSLVQVGLDTHDRVENGAPGAKLGTLSARTQQLKVLAGDYFSSRFYNLLAQAGHIDVIRKLSEAICDVNRMKMTLYAKMKQMKLSADEYVQIGADLKSGLLLSFGSFLTGLYERLWPELVDRFSRCELLLAELDKVETSTRLKDSWGAWLIWNEGSDEDRLVLSGQRTDASDEGALRALFDQYDIHGKLGALLGQAVSQLQTLLARLQSDKLSREVGPLLEPFLRATGLQPAAALKELG